MKQNLQIARMAALLACLAWLCWSQGCGPRVAPTGSVSGKVTCNGEPLASGTVTFINQAAGIGASANLDAAGSYHIATVNTGQYSVAIQRPPGPSPEEVEKGAKPARFDVPSKYLDPTTSGLTATVNEGANTADFAL